MPSRQASAHEVAKWAIFAEIQVTDRQTDTTKNIQLSLRELNKCDLQGTVSSEMLLNISDYVS